MSLKPPPKKIDLSHAVTFIDPDKATEYLCGVCYKTIRDATAICAYHIYCNDCVMQLFETRMTEGNYVTCPGCNAMVDINYTKRIQFIDREIGNLQTRCPNFQITPQKAIYLQHLQEKQSPTKKDDNHNRKKKRKRKNKNNSETRTRSRSRSRERYFDYKCF